MKKIFLAAALILTLFTPTTFAEEATTPPATTENTAANTESTATTANEDTTIPNVAVKDFVEYTSATYGYKIKCPFKPAVVNMKFDDPPETGEKLVFLNDGMEIVLGYKINLDAFPDNAAPDFNKADEKTLQSYLDYLKKVNPLDSAQIMDFGNNNKGVFMVTAKEIENDKGEKVTADRQIVMVIFRTPNGGRVSIQLLTKEFSQDLVNAFVYSVSTFDDKK